MNVMVIRGRRLVGRCGLVAAIGSTIVAAGCRSPGMPTSSGLRVTRIEYAEPCALYRPDFNARLRSEISGDALIDVVPLLDETGVSSLPGDVYSAGQMYIFHGCSAVLTVHLVDQPSRAFNVDSCYEPHVCAFLERAAAHGLIRVQSKAACDRRVLCKVHSDGWPT